MQAYQHAFMHPLATCPTISCAQAALWLALFHNASSLLADFHQQLGDLDISISPWRQKGGFLVLLRTGLKLSPCVAVASPAFAADLSNQLPWQTVFVASHLALLKMICGDG